MSEENTPLQQLASELDVVPAVPTGGKDRIYLPGGRTQILDTADALYRRLVETNEWFFRGGQVVIKTQANGDALPVLEIIKPTKARSEFEKYAEFYVHTKDGAKPAVMSEDIAKALLAASTARDILPNLTGLLNCPLLLLQDNEIHVLSSGYDTRTGYFVTGKAAVEPKSVEDAVTIIQAVIVDFAFQNDSDISRAIAALLTPALKFGGFIKSAIPIEIVEANDSQTGKGYFLLLRCAVYGEVPTYIIQKKGGVGSFDESFASALIKGRPFVMADNLRGRLDSPCLESFATADGLFPARVPHTGDTYIDASRYVLSFTSNGIETTKDLANRATFIRLQKQHAYDFQNFEGDDILTMVRIHQPMFLGAVFKVIRHWFELGMQRTNEKRHDRRDWAQINDWIVQHIFKEAPLLDGHMEAKERIQNPHLTFLRLVAVELERRHQLELPFTATKIFDLSDETNIPIPGLVEFHKHNADYGKKVIGKVMNKVFGTNMETVIESFRVTKEEQLFKTETGNTERLKMYTFTRMDGGTARVHTHGRDRLLLKPESNESKESNKSNVTNK